MGKKVTLGFLGHKFQQSLINQILHPANKKFSERIIDIIHAPHFDNEYFRLIIVTIKDYYERFEKVPEWDTLEIILKMEIKDTVTQDYIFAITKEVRDLVVSDWNWVQEKSLNFCRQQELKKANDQITEIIDEGDFDNYEKCAEILKEALSIGAEKDDGVNISDDFESVLDDDYRNPIPTGITGIDEITDGGISKGELAVVLAPYGVGKSQPLTSNILTPKGWVKMGDIKVDDDIMGSDGNKQKVLGVYPQGKRPIYKITFSDNTFTHCDGEHLWKVNDLNQRGYAKKKGKNQWDYHKVMKTTDMVDKLRVTKNNSLNYAIPNIEPINMDYKEIPLDPYTLGIMLGDGCLTKSNYPKFFTKDLEIIKNVEETYGVENVSLKNRKRFVDTEVGDTLIKVERSLYYVTLKKSKPIFEGLNLYGCDSSNKFIPKNYMYNNVWVRERLLQGLIDSDGSIDDHRVEYTTVSEQLSEDVRELVLSLGGRCFIKVKHPYYTYRGEKKYGKKAFRLYISFPDNGIKPSLLKRKIERYKPRTKYANKLIENIEFSHDEEAQCIYVSNDDHLYVTDDYILTHNTTVLTKIANSAYNAGHNVLQIIFEDMPKVIQRKHAACWTGINLGELSENKEDVIKQVHERTNRPNQLIIKKFTSEGVTMNTIRAYIRHLIATGVKPDILILDYIDCVESVKSFNASWDGEGNVMRAFETMLVEYDMAGWTAVQGNRSSISADVVTGDQMGGSIKRAQIGHFIISVAKTLPQKEAGLATIAVLKSRFGKDGVIYENCTFDNGTVFIDTTTSETFLGYEKTQEDKQEERVRDRIKRAKAFKGSQANTEETN